jgi:hypothetical protein
MTAIVVAKLVSERQDPYPAVLRIYRAFTVNPTINGFFYSKAHNLRGSAWRLGS